MEMNFVSIFYLFGSLLLLLLNVKGHTVCYPPYGCFTDDQPFDHALAQLPEHPDKIGTKFLYYTRQTRNKPKLLDLNSKTTATEANFNPNSTTVIFSHGYIENRYRFYAPLLIDELLKYEDMNVIFVEWAAGAVFPYHQAYGNARVVGAQLGLMIEIIKNDTGINWNKLRVVGFSIGAHIAGYAGRNLRRKGIILPRITGLDPAAPYYENEHIDVRLDTTDADFVDIIHTDSKTLIFHGFGFLKRLGHVDFYPNGGYHQIGCGKIDLSLVQYVACSHHRAVRYWIESINSNCPYYGYPCKTWKDFKSHKCTKCPAEGCPRMGYHIKKPSQIIDKSFYMHTRDEFPYCAHHYEFTFLTNYFMMANLNDVIVVELFGEQDTEKITLPHNYYKRNTAKAVVGFGKKHLGNLKSIKVSHNAFFKAWFLKAVKVKPMYTQKEYTACYGIWLNNFKNQRDLKAGFLPQNCPSKQPSNVNTYDDVS